MIHTGILILVITLVLIFLSLSILHFYWGFGGKWGLAVALPSLEDNIPLFRPSVFITLLIALALLGCACLFLLVIAGSEPEMTQYIFWMISVVFLARVIGDFKFIGIFKKHKHTRFAVNDSKYYTPLSFIITTLVLLLLMWMNFYQHHNLIS